MIRASLRHDTHLPYLVFFLLWAAASATPAPAREDPARDQDRAGSPVPPAWLESALEEIRRQEYGFSRTDDGAFSAPNRAHDLRSRITDGVVEVTSRTGGPDAWRLTLRLEAFGREGSLRSPGEGDVQAEGARVEIHRGDLVRWYVNDERGLEQGFTIDAPPEGADASLPVVLEIAFGRLEARLEPGSSVVFSRPGRGDVLRYAELVVRDAGEALLPAHLDVRRGALRIEVEDRGALYPIVVDPIMTIPGANLILPQPDAFFGLSVATAGDVNGDGFSDVIVGSPYYDGGDSNEGRVNVYLGSPVGIVNLTAWYAESDVSGALLGSSVASAGDVNGDGYDDIIAGAPYYTNGQGGEGVAYLWLGSASFGDGADGTPANADWSYEPNVSGARFGAAVATAGDVSGDGRDDVIVGAPELTNGEVREGRAYVFLGAASGLAVLPAWTAESDQAGVFPFDADPELGRSVGTAGDVNADGFADVIIGAPGYNAPLEDEGAVFVWFGSASFGAGADGTPANASWYAEGDVEEAMLGSSVATAGDVNGDGRSDIIAGAPFHDVGSTFEGRAMVWHGEPGGLGPIGSPANADWYAESDQYAAHMGEVVATAGDVNGDGFADVLVSAIFYDDTGTNEGRAFAWFGSPSGLGFLGNPANADWYTDGVQDEARLGMSLGTAGDVNGDGLSDVIVGAPLYDLNEVLVDAGRAIVFEGRADGLASAAPWGDEGDLPGVQLGHSVAAAGDVNGDGYGDLIVGAPFYDNGETDEGRVFVYIGTKDGPALAPAWTAESQQASAQFGGSVAGGVDVNGDGYSDVAAGAPLYDKAFRDTGRVFVWHGGPPSPGNDSGLGASGDPNNADGSVDGGQAFERFGEAVANAGDVNGDGFGDLIIGAPLHDAGQTDEGRAWVHEGSPGGLGASIWSAEGNQAGIRFGQSVAGAGDVNGDGFSDVIVGAWGYSNGESVEGAAFVYLGSGSSMLLLPQPHWMAESNQADARFGASVAGAGDVNGDGFSDVIVGAPLYDSGETDEGAAFVWHGGPAGMGPDGEPGNAATLLEIDSAGAQLGEAVASAGDVDGDGFGDAVVGAPLYTSGQASEGAAKLWFGGVGGLVLSYFPLSPWLFESNDFGAQLGNAVAGAGDVNGDGYSDVIVGASRFNAIVSEEGRVYLFYGNGGEGLDRIPRQARHDGSGPLHLLGKSASASSFRIRVQGRTPAGRGRIRLQWEVEPLGAPFDGEDLVTQSVWTDTGFPVAPFGSIEALEDTVTGLLPGFHRWRVRILGRSPLFPRSPWLSPQGNGSTETDLRTAGCIDRDFDGYGAPGDFGCAAGPSPDCNDLEAEMYPGRPEICDTLDNDCDGAADGFATTCGVGECAGSGTCVAGVDDCMPGAPSPEVCDDLDNNCDGTTDGFNTTCGLGQCASVGTCFDGINSCTPGTPSPEECDGVDNDCDGALPAGEADADGDGVMVCKGDCNDADPAVFAAPGQVLGLDVTDLVPGPGFEFTWTSQAATAGSGTVYDVFEAADSDLGASGDFSTGSCAEEDLGLAEYQYTGPLPPLGDGFVFIFRGQNACPGGTGTWGTPNRDATAAASTMPCL